MAIGHFNWAIAHRVISQKQYKKKEKKGGAMDKC